MPEPFGNPVDIRIEGCQTVLPLRQVLSASIGGQIVTGTAIHFLFACILNDNRLIGTDKVGSFSWTSSPRFIV